MIPKLYPQSQMPPVPRLEQPRVAPRPPTVQPSPATPQPSPYERVASQLQGVTAKRIQAYLKDMPHLTPEQAGAAVAVDLVWAERAKARKLVTGDPLNDSEVWKRHWAFNTGRETTDPLLSQYPDELETIVKRAQEIVQEQRAAQQREKAGVPKLQM